MFFWEVVSHDYSRGKYDIRLPSIPRDCPCCLEPLSDQCTRSRHGSRRSTITGLPSPCSAHQPILSFAQSSALLTSLPDTLYSSSCVRLLGYPSASLFLSSPASLSASRFALLFASLSDHPFCSSYARLCLAIAIIARGRSDESKQRDIQYSHREVPPLRKRWRNVMFSCGCRLSCRRVWSLAVGSSP